MKLGMSPVLKPESCPLIWILFFFYSNHFPSPPILNRFGKGLSTVKILFHVEVAMCLHSGQWVGVSTSEKKWL